jgi:hypothetical protein
MCGRFGLDCTGTRPKIGGTGGGWGWLSKVRHWVWQNKWTILSWTEVGLGVLSMFTGLGLIADIAFFAGSGLSMLSTAHSCASGARSDCIFGAVSIGMGGAGFGIGRVAARLRDASDAALAAKGFFKPVIKSAFLGTLSSLAYASAQTHNGISVIMSGLSNLPCSAFQQPGRPQTC